MDSIVGPSRELSALDSYQLSAFSSQLQQSLSAIGFQAGQPLQEAGKHPFTPRYRASRGLPRESHRQGVEAAGPAPGLVCRRLGRRTSPSCAPNLVRRDINVRRSATTIRAARRRHQHGDEASARDHSTASVFSITRSRVDRAQHEAPMRGRLGRGSQFSAWYRRQSGLKVGSRRL